MLIQLHILQNYAPANLNRDDTGSPKDCLFGGYRRGRISSQCLKRAMRRSQTFADAFKAQGLLGDRTQYLPRLVEQELASRGLAEADRKNITKRLNTLGGGKGDKEDKTNLLIFLGQTEVAEITDRLYNLYQEVGAKKFVDDKALKPEELEKAMIHNAPRSIDISMFGRMTTSAAFQDVHASVQVAHAISTNALETQFDYFTAVDDLKPADEDAGAGMIGDVEFNSSTYYKYINIHWEKLLENLGGDLEIATRAVAVLIEAAAFSQPSGKQNTFAAHNLPDFILATVSPRNVPTSYANAFINPAKQTSKTSLMDDSIAKLEKHIQTVQQTYPQLVGSAAYIATGETGVASAEKQANLLTLQQWVIQQITEATHA